MAYNRSPIYYPGGKAYFLKYILPMFPDDIGEYREPFFGGGSVGLNVKAQKRWVNDLDPAIFNFWYWVKNNPVGLMETIETHKQQFENDGKGFYLWAKERGDTTIIDAAKVYIKNKLSFGADIYKGGFVSEYFTGVSKGGSFRKSRVHTFFINRIGGVDLKNTKITNYDYSQLLETPGQNVFIYLDPPYKITYNKLYKGHSLFNHQRLAEALKKCTHNWLLSYNDSEEIRCLYSWAMIKEIQVSYNITTNKQKKKELLICPKQS